MGEINVRLSEGRKLRRTALKQILERAGGVKGVDAAFPSIAASADLHPPLQPLRREEGMKSLPEAHASSLQSLSHKSSHLCRWRTCPSVPA